MGEVKGPESNVQDLNIVLLHMVMWFSFFMTSCRCVDMNCNMSVTLRYKQPGLILF